jgi:hypothetical protein
VVFKQLVTNMKIQPRKGPGQTVWKPEAANHKYKSNITRPVMEPFTDDEEDEKPEGAPNGASKLGIGRRRGNNGNGPSGGAAGLAA